MAKLEVCCYSIDCALTAEQSGADRIELCSGLRDGGLTPSYGVLRQARERISIPVHPMVRPRGGDFCYSAAEFASIQYDIDQIREMGFPGVVVGVLDEEGHIDLPRMKKIMSRCDGMAVTFHRAFDMSLNPRLALDQLTDMGVARILTSGQQQSAENGLILLRELNQASRGPIIMAGSGIRLTNLNKFRLCGIQELHSSAGQWVASPMRYRKVGVTLCSDGDAGMDELQHYCVDGDMVAAMKSALNPDKASLPVL
ncbi:copper homeostasis protein CutC [Pectobacteriaceae bacterium CE90]|nr:copper homeostasis protein CutC [Prodigiosinella sp. LS101]WJV55628.1 copper homeostasis protein CutC [Prodigiosinella sp. LS101]WJV59989.1 copper homeostasis protein CutC [Pectobacteriaceae bacterium C111]WJY13308.1 copper homeostasis protein CutC [Pectobacteriaceae bacterium CE90]